MGEPSEKAGDSMTTMAVITEAGAIEVDVAAGATGSSVCVSVDAVRDALGWEVKPEGLCRGDVCVPAPSALARDADGRVDLVAIADALQRPVLIDDETTAMVIGSSAADRRSALRDKQLPAFSLPDLDGQVHHSDEWRGSKLLLVAFASW